MKMKAITISQPWADLISRNKKFIENRHWPTSYRGNLAIHAGKGTQYLSKQELAKHTTGAIVAVTEMVACLQLSELRKQPRDLEIEGTPYTVGQILNHEYTEGPFLWVFYRTYAVNPIVMPGKQGLWIAEFDGELLEHDPEKSTYMTTN